MKKGFDGNGEFIGRFCGVKPPNDGQELVSENGGLWIRFKSDSSKSGKGFKATWKVESETNA